MASGKNLLLVEGNDDKHVAEHIWRRHQPKPDSSLPFEIENKKGRSNLLRSISAELKVPDRENLGILLDANDCVISRWQEVVNRVNKLNNLRVRLPENPKKSGTIVETTRLRIGIWFMPNNDSPSELEDSIRELIPDKDPIWPRAQHYIKGIPQEERKFKPQKELRAPNSRMAGNTRRPASYGASNSSP